MMVDEVVEDESPALTLLRRISSSLHRTSDAVAVYGNILTLVGALPDLIDLHRAVLPNEKTTLGQLAGRLETLRKCTDSTATIIDRLQDAAKPLYQSVTFLSYGPPSEEVLASIHQELEASNCILEQILPLLDLALPTDNGPANIDDRRAQRQAADSLRAATRQRTSEALRVLRMSLDRLVALHRSLLEVSYGYVIADSQDDYPSDPTKVDSSDLLLGIRVADSVTAYQIQLSRFAAANPDVAKRDAEEIDNICGGEGSVATGRVLAQMIHQSMISISVPSVRLGSCWAKLARVATPPGANQELSIVERIAESLSRQAVELALRMGASKTSPT